jgi:threonine/homoserine/homoserine lactone efflux protein
MALEHALAFFVFAFVAAVTPGPSNIMVTATGAAVGVVRGLPCVVGVALSMAALIFAVTLGLGQVVLAHAAVLTALNGAGAAFLLWLAWKIASAPVGGAAAAARPVGFREAALFQWINPKGWMVATSAAGAYLQAGAEPLAQALALGLLFAAAALPSNLVWLAFGAAMQRLLTSPRAARWFNFVMGATLAASVVMILR